MGLVGRVLQTGRPSVGRGFLLAPAPFGRFAQNVSVGTLGRPVPLQVANLIPPVILISVITPPQQVGGPPSPSANTHLHSSWLTRSASSSVGRGSEGGVLVKVKGGGPCRPLPGIALSGRTHADQLVGSMGPGGEGDGRLNIYTTSLRLPRFNPVETATAGSLGDDVLPVDRTFDSCDDHVVINGLQVDMALVSVDVRDDVTVDDGDVVHDVDAAGGLQVEVTLVDGVVGGTVVYLTMLPLMLVTMTFPLVFMTFPRR
ncbi:hypothetical protein BDK51DRAFT_50498 [Blyttiomyces helicus]|uniref:Uncharacterized protein n=1 Tax=Blyttiomyces helicus TaxID=388810 RepID=A0A4P9WLY5_9FUNG|nr:hypothetical protein BDK51DRAFT_50498 [Blyttiomyces helicus]|eukprot:RKO92658.1 hypothetical protein BDK51DRAFT_50498 [Blyttiomyces helicus]